MTTIQLKPTMGEAVMARLADLTPLPDRGLVAGQAVASALSELFGDGRAVVYNDVDVFREYSRDEESKKRRTLRESNRVLNTVNFRTMDVVNDYGHLRFESYSRYSVVKTRREGLLNDVACRFGFMNYGGVLDTFDMNCVQVGVDLANKQLVWTPAYEEFTRTHQLEIANMQTPFHSLIRYFKKRTELDGVYGNDARMLELVALAAELEMATTPAGRDAFGEEESLRWRFGHVYKERFDKVDSAILPHFDLVQEVQNGQPLFRLKPRFNVDADLLQAALPHACRPQFWPTISRALREKHRPGIADRLRYLVCQPQPSLVWMGWRNEGDKYLKTNVTPAQMKRLDDLVREHSVSTHFRGMPLAEQVIRAQWLKAEAAHRGDWVYGVLENRYTIEEVAPGKASNFWSQESLKALLDKEAEYLSQSLAEPLLPTVQLDGYLGKELTTGMALQSEGHVMHHCVAGYSSSVDAGRCRIVSLRTGNHPSQWLTMETVKRQGVWQNAQLRGLQNRSATAEELEVANRYLSLMTVAEWLGASLALRLNAWSPAKVLQLAQGISQLADLLPGSPHGEPTGVLARCSERLRKKLDLPYSVEFENDWAFSSMPYKYWRIAFKVFIRNLRSQGWAVCNKATFRALVREASGSEIPF